MNPLIFSKNILPSSWQENNDDPVYIFNPSLIKHPAGGFILAYRVVLRDGMRRIGICKLDSIFSVIPGSPLPFSEVVCFEQERDLPSRAKTWFADPRMLWWRDRLYLYWNSGSHAPHNYQFIQEIDVNSLQPIGKPFTIECTHQRRSVEKNWGLFENKGELYAIYSLHPFIALKLTQKTSSAFIFSPLSNTSWNAQRFTRRFGELRGGSAPVRYGDKLYLFCHARMRQVLRYRYIASVLIVNAEPPFTPIAFLPKPLKLPDPFNGRFINPRLNASVTKVIYPMAAVVEKDHLIISYGINDERAAVCRYGIALIDSLAKTIKYEAYRRDYLNDVKVHVHAVAANWLMKRGREYRQWRRGRNG